MIATGLIGGVQGIFLIFLLGLAVFIIVRFATQKRTRRNLLQRPFSADEETILDRQFPRHRSVPEALRSRHAGFTRVLMTEKNFEPCGGLSEVTGEMKLVIAAQAAVLLLELPKHGFFPRLRSILVYPGAFHDPGRRNFDLPEAEDRGILLGESWDTGSVILSWDSVVAGGRNADDGMNVVMHEFAHQLDLGNGEVDGVPLLRSRSAYLRWAEVFGREFAALVEASGNRSAPEPFLDPYGATHPSEFFAVATETFFEDPEDLKSEHPELYDQLKDYYGLDPASW